MYYCGKYSVLYIRDDTSLAFSDRGIRLRITSTGVYSMLNAVLVISMMEARIPTSRSSSFFFLLLQTPGPVLRFSRQRFVPKSHAQNLISSWRGDDEPFSGKSDPFSFRLFFFLKKKRRTLVIASAGTNWKSAMGTSRILATTVNMRSWECPPNNTPFSVVAGMAVSLSTTRYILVFHTPYSAV